jgi:hypothetical protein
MGGEALLTQFQLFKPNRKLTKAELIWAIRLNVEREGIALDMCPVDEVAIAAARREDGRSLTACPGCRR